MGAKRTQARASALDAHAAGQEGTLDRASPEESGSASASVVTAGPADWLLWLRARIGSDRVATWTVLIMGALLFLPCLGSVGLWDPWETHYGEVAREMIARHDYVYPYWESAYFFSKPALPLWMIAFGLKLVGAEDPAYPDAPLGALTEWGVRLPFALIGIFSLWAVYRIGRQMRDRTTGVLAAFVLASSAQFIFIGKQAMVDMPFVGLMTGALAFFLSAVFDKSEDAPATLIQKVITCAGIGISVFVQVALIASQIQGLTNPPAASLIAASAIAIVAIGYIFVLGSRRDCWLAGFYVLMGLSALSKGLGPLAVVGPVVVLYIVFTGDWRILLRCRLMEGTLLFLAVSVPWYLTLSLFNGRDDEGKTFVTRFWLHDNFGRVGAGVHGDRGNLGYFIEQLAYGMFPWIAVVPSALGLAAKRASGEKDVEQRRIVVFVLLWAVWTYFFFSALSQTKFHHYIFPALPALALLVADWLVEVAEDPAKRIRAFAFVLMAMIFGVAFRDIVNEPQTLVNLFTYKYDRDYPREVDPRPWLVGILVLAAVFVLVDLPRLRLGWPGKGGAGDSWRSRVLVALGVFAGLFGAWISHYHFNMLSPHWSQWHLFKTYFEARQGGEPLYAYQLNWRGETFYSRNHVVQVKENGADQRMRQLVDRPGREFIITEQSRYHTLQSILSPDKRDKIRILDKSNNKFYLCVVDE